MSRVGQASDDMQVMYNSTATQIKEIFAQTAIARTSPLPSPDVGQGMLDGDPLPQLGSPQWGQLPLP